MGITSQFSAPYESSFLVQIDNEQMLVTGVVTRGTAEDLQVTRGYNGAAAASHAAQSNVFFNYGSREDYVNTTLEYDIDIDASVGCATLFLYYLNWALNLSKFAQLDPDRAMQKAACVEYTTTSPRIHPTHSHSSRRC